MLDVERLIKFQEIVADLKSAREKDAGKDPISMPLAAAPLTEDAVAEFLLTYFKEECVMSKPGAKDRVVFVVDGRGNFRPVSKDTGAKSGPMSARICYSMLRSEYAAGMGFGRGELEELGL